MKIHLYSDTHGYLHKVTQDVDVSINAGDGNSDGKGLIITCLGNHEFYNDSIVDYDPRDGQSVVEYMDTVFISCTLWSNFWGISRMDDFKYFGRALNDFHFIKGMSISKMIELFNNDFDFIKENVEKYKDRNIVIATHFAPSKKAIHPKYEGDRLNRYFANDLDNFILSNPQIKTWCFGHTHSSMDFMIGECRCVCNPLGYKMPDGTFENPDFNPNLIIEL